MLLPYWIIIFVNKKNWTYNFLFICKCNLKIYVTFPCFLLLRLFCDWWNYFFMWNVLEVIGKVGWGQFEFRWTVNIEGFGLKNLSKFVVDLIYLILFKIFGNSNFFQTKKHIYGSCQLLNANNKTFLSNLNLTKSSKRA